MSKKIEEIDEDVVAEVEVTEEEPKNGVLSKIGSFAKKHGKKVLVAGLLGGAFILGNKTAKMSSKEDTYSDYDSEDISKSSDAE